MSKGCKATVTVKSHEGFCVHGIVPCRQTTRRRQLSRYGQHGQDVNGGSVKYYCLKGGISLCWLSLLLRVATRWTADVKTVRHLDIYQLVQCISEICRMGSVLDGGAKTPDLSLSELCGVIHECQLVAIGVFDVSAVETFAVMRTQTKRRRGLKRAREAAGYVRQSAQSGRPSHHLRSWQPVYQKVC